MNNNSLENFILEIKKIWGPLNSETVSKSRSLLENLAKTPVTEQWLSKLLNTVDLNQELYRDPEHGFILLAYTENKNLYREPHDHGSGWVIYAVQSGEMEMKTYKPTIDQKGNLNLVCRESYRVLPGDCKAYLPDDVHDTKCISDVSLIFRLTSCDLKKEYREGRMRKYETHLHDSKK